MTVKPKFQWDTCSKCSGQEQVHVLALTIGAQWDTCSKCSGQEQVHVLALTIGAHFVYFKTIKHYLNNVLCLLSFRCHLYSKLLNYSQTCLMWPSKGTLEYDHIRQVINKYRFIYLLWPSKGTLEYDHIRQVAIKYTFI